MPRSKVQKNVKRLGLILSSLFFVQTNIIASQLSYNDETVVEQVRAEAYLELGKICMHDKEYANAFDYFQQAIKENDDLTVGLNARLELAKMYAFGQGVDQDFSQAIAYAHKIRDLTESKKDEFQLIREIAERIIGTNILKNWTHLACRYGWLEQIKHQIFLLGIAKPRLNAASSSRYWEVSLGYRDQEDNTPLYYAIYNGHEEIVDCLLEEEFIIAQIKSSSLYLQVACARNNETIAFKLLKKGADVAAKNSNGETALHSAAISANAGVMRLLIDNNAEINVQDTNGNAPLHSAIKNGNKVTALTLLRMNADVTLCDNEGNTPLHCAASLGQTGLCKKLIKKNASIKQENKRGFAPYICALVNGHEETTKLLLSKEADGGARGIRIISTLGNYALENNEHDNVRIFFKTVISLSEIDTKLAKEAEQKLEEHFSEKLRHAVDLLEGNGVIQDYAKAEKYFLDIVSYVSESRIRALACLNLSRIYYFGLGCERDDTKVNHYLEILFKELPNINESTLRSQLLESVEAMKKE